MALIRVLTLRKFDKNIALVSTIDPFVHSVKSLYLLLTGHAEGYGKTLAGILQCCKVYRTFRFYCMYSATATAIFYSISDSLFSILILNLYFLFLF